MGYDIQMWSTEPFDNPRMLPSLEKWSINGNHWSYFGETWMLSMGPSARVSEEDIPVDVFAALPGIAYLVAISLEPISAPKIGFAMLQKSARAIARNANGAIFDPQENTVELPSGVRRSYPTRTGKEHGFALLRMSWWFDHEQVLNSAWISQFLSLLDDQLPEAMPARYGLVEPPQNIYAETGRDHLVAFLVQSLTNWPVWYANRPVIGCSFSVKTTCGWQKLGYRCNHITVSFEAAALQQPGWPTAIRRFWQKASILLKPFFGDVRTLRGFHGRPPRVLADDKTESHPVKSWWWHGIPPKLGHATVVGEPYIEHWPELQSVAECNAGLLFLSTDDWNSSQEASELLGDVPSTIALPFMPYLVTGRFGVPSLIYPDIYPEVFPFGSAQPDPKNRNAWGTRG